MIQTFFIVGPLPGLNEIIKADRTGRYVGARLKKQATKRVCEEIIAAKLTPIKGPVHLTIICGEPNRRRDPMNVTAGALKILCDSLVEMGIIEGDGWAVFGGEGGWKESVILAPAGHPGGVSVSLREAGVI